MRGNLVWKKHLLGTEIEFVEDENGEYEVVDGGRITQPQIQFFGVDPQAKQSKSERPPLGIMPEWRWKELRLEDIREAMTRFNIHHKNTKFCPQEWLDEKHELEKWLSDREDKKQAKQSQPEDNPEKDYQITLLEDNYGKIWNFSYATLRYHNKEMNRNDTYENFMKDGAVIHGVLRKSDNQEFTVDEITEQGKIKNFEFWGDTMIAMCYGELGNIGMRLKELTKKKERQVLFADEEIERWAKNHYPNNNMGEIGLKVNGAKWMRDMYEEKLAKEKMKS